MKTLLLTGASGFLGGHIKKYYTDQDWKVLTLGRAQDSDYKLNVENLNDLLNLNIDENISRIIHSAAVNEVTIKDDLALTYQVNVTLARMLMELAGRHGISEFIYISTFHVYGRSSGNLSNHTVPAPVNDYGLTHYLSENIVLSLAEPFNITPLIVRPTNIYGIPIDFSTFNRWSLVPFDFVRLAVTKSKIVLKSSGVQLRNFVDVIDVLAAIDLIGRAEVVNAYGLDTESILSFAKRVSRLVSDNIGTDSKVEWQANDGDAVSCLNVTNIGNEYMPVHSLDEFIAAFSEQVKANV